VTFVTSLKSFVGLGLFHVHILAHASKKTSVKPIASLFTHKFCYRPDKIGNVISTEGRNLVCFVLVEKERFGR